MFHHLVSLGNSLLEYLPTASNILITPVYDLGYDFITSLGGTGTLYERFFDVLWLAVGPDLANIGIDIYSMSVIGFVLGPGLIAVIMLAVVMFVLTVIDKIIPI